MEEISPDSFTNPFTTHTNVFVYLILELALLSELHHISMHRKTLTHTTKYLKACQWGSDIIGKLPISGN